MSTRERDDICHDMEHLRQSLRQARNKRRQLETAKRFSIFSKQVAVLLYHKHSNANAAVAFLREREKIHRMPANSDDNLRHLVEEEYLAISVEHLVCLDEAWDNSSSTVARFAHKWLEKWRLALWVEHQNHAIGVAPSSSRVLLQRDAWRNDEGRPESLSRRAITTVSRYGLVWTQRFRRRFSLKLLKLRVRDTLTLEAMRAKAPFCRDALGSAKKL